MTVDAHMHEKPPIRKTSTLRHRSRTRSHSDARTYMRSSRRRLVGILKIILPLSAILLSALLVIWSVFDQTAPQEDLSLLETAQNTKDGSVELGAQAARFYGQDSMGQPFTITADKAVHFTSDPKEVDLVELQADIVLNNGMWITVSAPEGLFHHDDKVLMLDGGINMFSDRGYEFFTDVILFDLGSGTATSESPINGQGPFGVVQADRFRATNMGKTLYFDGSVKGTLYPLALREQNVQNLNQGNTEG